MKKFIFLLICFWIIPAYCDLIMQGDAFNEKNVFIYRETLAVKHFPSGDIREIKTTYHNARQELIAEMQSDFNRDAFIPDTVYIDHRFNEKQEVKLDQEKDQVILSLTDLKTQKVKTKILNREKNMIAGQGLHNFIIKNFEEQKMAIKYIVLARRDYFSFKLAIVPSPLKDHRRFEMKMANWLLQKLVKEITVDYHIKDKALMVFQGQSNVETDDRKTQDVRINYTFFRSDKNDR